MDRRTMIGRACGATLLAAAWLAGMVLPAAGVHAQEKTPIRLMVGFAPGGVTDTIARILADALRVELDRPVVVENRPGAGGRLAAEVTRSAGPEAFLLNPDGWAIFPTLLHSPAALKYDFHADFAPVARVISFPMALVINDMPRASNAKEYAAWLKADPKRAVFGSAGAGSITQFLGNVVGQALGTPMTVVPYKGNGPLTTDLIAGQIPAGIMVAGDALKMRNDKLKVFLLSEQRWALEPDVPTLKEQGYDVTMGNSWMGIWTSSKTPKAVLERMQNALGKVLAQPAVRERLEKSAVATPDFATAAEFDRQVRDSLKYWDPVIKASGFKPD